MEIKGLGWLVFWALVGIVCGTYCAGKILLWIFMHGRSSKRTIN